MSRARAIASPRVLAPLALMALIFWSSAQSSGGGFPEWIHKIVHFSEYAVLAALWLWALLPSLGVRAYAAAAVISILYAISDEYHQSFVADRVSDPRDVLNDALGVTTALTMAYARGRASTRRTE